MKFLLVSLFILSTQFAVAQSQGSNSIEGIVKDREDASPVPFAYLYLKNYPDFSVLADDQGKFTFYFPSQFMTDNMVITCIGYVKKEFSIASMKKSGNTIMLERQLISLNEITVLPENSSMVEMISKAIDNIPTNYPKKRHQLSGFYRKVSTNYDEFTKLMEAAILVEDFGDQRDWTSLKIKLEALRQSDEMEEIDSTLAILKLRIRNHIASSGDILSPLNTINGTYNQNILRRSSYNSNTVFGKDGYRFMGIPEIPTYHRFMGEEIVDNDTIYQIAFSNKDPPNGSSYLKINTRNHAFVEYQITWLLGEYQTFVKFKEIDGVYYPEMIRIKELRLINRDIGTHHMDISTLWFDEVFTNDLKRIRAKDALGRNEELESNKYELDSNFWREYDLVRKYPLDSAIIKSLGKYKSLEEQFKINAKD